MAELLQREQTYTPLWQQIGNNLNFFRWAGFSGAIAVILAAYGGHGHQFKGDKHMFETANRLHFIHTLVLLALPLARRPAISGTLFLIGTLAFCGGFYYRALAGEDIVRFFPQIGGVTLIIAWLSLMF